MGERGGLNLPAFARNQPSVLLDPMGLMSIEDCARDMQYALQGGARISSLYQALKKAKDRFGIPCLRSVECLSCCLPGIRGFYNPVFRSVGLCAENLGSNADLRTVLEHELYHAESVCGWWKLGCENCMKEEKRAYYLAGQCTNDSDCTQAAWESCLASLSCSSILDKWQNYLGAGWPVRR